MNMSRKNKASIIAIIVGISGIVGLLMPYSILVVASAQVFDIPIANNSSTRLMTQQQLIANAKLYTNEEYNYKVLVPDKWAITDFVKTDKERVVNSEEQLGYSVIAALCVESEAAPAIGGEVDCSNTSQQTGAVPITRYINLQDRSDVQAALSQGKQLTPRDILALDIKMWQESSNPGAKIRVLNISQPYIIRAAESGQNYTAINASTIYNSIPPQSSAGAPPILQGPYNSLNPSYLVEDFAIYILAPDGNTAYEILWGTDVTTPTTTLEPPLPIRVIMQSFQPLM